METAVRGLLTELGKAVSRRDVDASLALFDTGPTRVTVTQDKDRPNVFLTIVEFADEATAQANSSRPETHEYAQKMAALCDGPPKFYNLDVIHQMNA